MRKPLVYLAVILFAVMALSSCSPMYVLRAAYEQGKILASRERIEDVVRNPSTSDTERGKLQLVSEARKFASSLGLDPGESFTRYARVDRDVLVWVLVGSKPDSFTLHNWWFPIVGSVPYKGFFDKEDALEAAEGLEKKGFETWVRGSDAFSTLGWFNDPVLSTTLRHDDTRIVNTVLHESTHSTLWIKGSVPFNESFANFVGFRATIDFYEERFGRCEDEACREEASKYMAFAHSDYTQELELAQVVGGMYDELQALYESVAPFEEKMAKRAEIFERNIAPLRVRYPRMNVFKKINNAEIMQFKLYLTGLRDFERLFLIRGHRWDLFLAEVAEIGKHGKDDLFAELSRRAFGPAES